MIAQATQAANWPPITPRTDVALLHCTVDGECFKDRLLNAGEVAEILGLGRSKVYEMMACGELPTVRIVAKAVSEPRSGFDATLKARTTPPVR